MGDRSVPNDRDGEESPDSTGQGAPSIGGVPSRRIGAGMTESATENIPSRIIFLYRKIESG